MKTVIMNLRPGPLAKIKSGTKVYELRLYDDKRRTIAVGDEIVFNAGDDVCRVQVTGLVIAPTFRDLFDIIPMNLCGYVDGDGYTAEHNGMDEFYPVSEQLKQAVVAIRVKRK
ncbi:ASCH domain-containing protein [bacterium]|nr:ASCH domain-containing protein [bacterium]